MMDIENLAPVLALIPMAVVFIGGSFMLTWQRIRHAEERCDRLSAKIDSLIDENRGLNRSISRLEYAQHDVCRFKGDK